MAMHERPPNAATDVEEFVIDLDGGRLEGMLSVALSQTAAAVIDNEKKGEVSLKFKFERIKGTSQVRIEHELRYSKPTTTGRSAEESAGATVMHVGARGKLSLAQPRLDLEGQGRQGNLTD